MSKKQNSETCVRCGKGETTAEKGSASCSKCDLGKKGSSKGKCSVCPIGQYQDGKGETSCKACGIDSYSKEPGKSSNADCTSCSADRSTGTVTGNTDESACLCKKTDYYQNKDKKCEKCPAGASCSTNGIKLFELGAIPGYWRSSTNTTYFKDCRSSILTLNEKAEQAAQQRCCPIDSATNISICENNTFTNPDEQCAVGYQGALCAACAPNYVYTNDACKQCPGGGKIDSVFLALVSSCGIFYVAVFIGLICVKEREDEEEETFEARINTKVGGNSSKVSATTNNSTTIGQLIMFGQILSSMPVTFDGVPWPPEFVAFLASIGAPFNLDFLSAFTVRLCVLLWWLYKDMD